MKLETCFNCLELEEVIGEYYFCPIWSKEVFQPDKAGCDLCKLPVKLREERRRQIYLDEELGIWY